MGRYIKIEKYKMGLRKDLWVLHFGLEVKPRGGRGSSYNQVMIYLSAFCVAVSHCIEDTDGTSVS